MRQFVFSSQLAPLMRSYLETRACEGYTSDNCGYYLQELDVLSQAGADLPFVTKALVDEWDSLKPHLTNRTKIQRHNTMRKFSAFAHTRDGISYVPDTSKLRNNSTFTAHIFTVEEIQRIFSFFVISHHPFLDPVYIIQQGVPHS